MKRFSKTFMAVWILAGLLILSGFPGGVNQAEALTQNAPIDILKPITFTEEAQLEFALVLRPTAGTGELFSMQVSGLGPGFTLGPLGNGAQWLNGINSQTGQSRHLGKFQAVGNVGSQFLVQDTITSSSCTGPAAANVVLASIDPVPSNIFMQSPSTTVFVGGVMHVNTLAEGYAFCSYELSAIYQ